GAGDHFLADRIDHLDALTAERSDPFAADEQLVAMPDEYAFGGHGVSPVSSIVIAKDRRSRGNPGRFCAVLDCVATLAMTTPLGSVWLSNYSKSSGSANRAACRLS